MKIFKRNLLSLVFAVSLLTTFSADVNSLSNIINNSNSEPTYKAAAVKPKTLAGNPGDIFLSKAAAQIPVACRTYQVTLGASGNPVPGYGNVDVVIVIDKSLSMDTDMNSVGNIAKQLVFKINDVAGNQVGLVSFNETAVKHTVSGSYFSSDRTAWNSTINGLHSGGASNIGTGILAAKEILMTSPRYSDPNVNKAIVVLSDGIASTSLAGNPLDGYAASDYTTAYNYAVAHAQAAAAANIIVFAAKTSATTPAGERTYGVQTMTNIGIDGYIEISSYSGDPKADGNIVFNVLSTHLYSAAANAVITDTIDPRFEFVSFVSYSSGTSAPTVAAVGGNEVITWNIGTVTQEAKTLIFRVRAKLEYPASIPVIGIVPTNADAYMTFTPAPGSSAVSPMNFPSADVYVSAPLAVILTDAWTGIGIPITLGTGTDPAGDNYMAVTGGWYVDAAIIAMYPGRFSSPIPQVLNYQWYLASDTGMTAPIDPTVIISADTQYRVKVTDTYGCTATATMWVRPRGTLTISKNITGTANPNQTFIFEIKQYSDAGKTTLVKTFYETIRVSGISNSRTVTNLPKGFFEVTEKYSWSWQYDPQGSTTASDTLGMNPDGSDNPGKSDAFVSFTDASRIINWISSIDWVTNLFTGGGS